MNATEDVLDKVVLAEDVVRRWQEAALDAVRLGAAAGVPIGAVPDECARVLADGSLEIYAILPNGARVSVIAEPQAWAWVSQN